MDAFRTAPLAFGLVSWFSSDGDVDDTEVESMQMGLSSSRRQASIFELPDLMATTKWFVYDVPHSPPLRSHREECSESEFEGGDFGPAVVDASSIRNPFFYSNLLYSYIICIHVYVLTLGIFMHVILPTSVFALGRRDLVSR